MANWWESPGLLPLDWNKVTDQTVTQYTPGQSYNYMTPGGLGMTSPMPTTGPVTGAGHTANIPGMTPQGQQQGAWMMGSTDPFYGYGGLFGQQPNQMGTPLAAMAPQQQMGGMQGAIPGGTPMAGGMQSGAAMNPLGNPAAQLPIWNPPSGFGSPSGIPEAQTQGNVTYSGVGSQENIMDRLFKGAATGQGGGPLAHMLYSLGMGQLPPAVAEGIVSQNNEQFGKLGARFGTDLATANARGLAQASEGQSMSAIDKILNLGQSNSTFQFSRGEAGLSRALQEYIAQLQNDPLQKILPALLGGLGGG